MPRHHKTLPRLFVTQPLVAGGEIALDKDQSNYLVAVLRKQVGDELVVFNGRDGSWLAVLSVANKKNAVLDLKEQTAEQPPKPDLWYGFAPLKTGRLDYMIQKATEMGVGAMQPVMTQHTQVSRLKMDKMRANAIEAAEQCEVLNVPDVLDEIGLPGLIDGWEQAHKGRALIFADEESASASPLETLKAHAGKPTGLIIGPEGGFSEEERALLLRQKFTVPISLGPRILRADTAAVAALAVVQSTIGDWR